MNYLEYIILGILQGITEFLPISSSGHLLIGRSIFSLDLELSDSFIEVFLHGGTLLSILLYWRKDILQELKDIINGKMEFIYCIIIGTIPAGVVGLIFKSQINKYFFDINNISYLCLSYFLLGMILLLTKKFKVIKYNTLLYSHALLIGIAQSLAILPGISRSGITIACALFLGLNPIVSTKFSFMLAIPILIFSFLDSMASNYYNLNNSHLLIPLIIGFITSFIIGYIAIGFLVKLIENNKLWYFAPYCIFISILIGLKYAI